MTGLTNEQVQQRIEEGKINVNENPNTRSYKQIVRENVLTVFQLSESGSDDYGIAGWFL